MKRRARTKSVLIALGFALCLPMTAATRVGILVDELDRGLSGEAVASAEALLSQAGVTLVERRQMRLIFTEQGLTVGSLRNADERMKLGKLTAADLFLSIRSASDRTNKLWRVQAVEARTGIALIGRAIEESMAATNVSPLVALVQDASALLATPHEVRRYVGIAGFRSEELNRSLDGLAESLGGFLPMELSTSPRVVVLDRENLVAIANEEAMTDAEVDLRPATVWIEGALRRLPDEGKLRVTLLFHPLPTGAARRVTFLSDEKLDDLLREMRSTILTELKLTRASSGAADLKSEAARFVQRAAQLKSHQKYEPAARAVDAALVLAPSQEYRLLAAQYWNDVGVYSHSALDRIRQGRKSPLEESTNTALQIEMLTVRLRASELYRDVLREHARINQNNPRVLAEVPKIKGNSLRGLEQLPPQGVAREAEPLRRELQRVHLEIYRATKQCFEGDWQDTHGRNDKGFTRHPQGRWCWYVGISLQQLDEWTDDLDEWCGLMREVINELKTRSFDAIGPAQKCFVWEHMAGASPSRTLNAEEREKLVAFHESFTSDPDEHVRLISLRRLHGLATSANRRSDVASARRMLDEFVKSMPVDHPTRVATKDYLYPFIIINDPMVNALIQNGEGDRYVHAILDPIIEQRLSDRLVAWSSMTRSWMGYLSAKKRTAELSQLTESLLELIENSPPQSKLEELTTYLRNTRAQLGVPDAQATAAWGAYQFQRVELSGKPGRSHLRAATIWSNEWLTAWAVRQGTTDVQVTLMRAPLAGGAMESLGQTLIKAGFRHAQDFSVLHIVPDTNAIYVQSENGGVAVFREGNVKALTEANGLPSDGVPWLVALNGKAYLGFHGALFDYDPTTERFRELASSSSFARPRNRLDGGERFSMRGMVADESRQCLWLSVGGSASDGRTGLWKYSPRSGLGEKVSSVALNRMHWQRGGLCGWTLTEWTIVSINPDTLAITPLLGFNQAKPHGAPLFGTHDGLSDPMNAVWIDDHLLTGWPSLALRTRSQRVPWERAGIGAEIVTLTAMNDGRILLATDDGRIDVLARNRRQSPARDR